MGNKSLAQLGFTDSKKSKLIPRLITAVSGLQGKGKTHWGLTAPGPIAFINLDDGLEGVIQKFNTEKKIHLLNLVLPDATIEDQALIKQQASEQWAKFYDAYYGALASPDIRTIIVDTATELRELQLMHLFGRTAQIMPYMYRDPNAKFRRIVRSAFEYDKNVVFLQKMKAVYENDKRTGRYEPAGFNDIGYLVQVEARMYRYSMEDGGDFAMSIEKCRQNPELVGEEFLGPVCNFQAVASMVLPDVDGEMWE